MQRKTVVVLLTIVLAIAALGVGRVAVTHAQEPIQVVATTTLIADVARNVAGDLVNVTSIIPEEVDEHVFIPSPGDVSLVADADVVLVNGAGLEEGLLSVVEENAAQIVVVSAGVPMIEGGHGHEDDEAEHEEGEDHAEEEDDAHEEHGGYEVIGTLGDTADCEIAHDDEHAEGEDHGDEEGTEEAEDEHEEGEDHDGHEDHGPCDPHVWMNPENVAIWAQNIAAALGELDPANADVYAANAADYAEQLTALNDEIIALVETIPADARVIVTNHEFLNYFAAEYDFEIVGTVIPSLTTSVEVSASDLADLIGVIEAENVQAIFTEIGQSEDLAQVLAAEIGREIAIVPLYSGYLSAEGGPAATYIDYMRYNANAIVSALAGA
jgi:ABC-type Zn uptake system ZnuABC Zn-binding protein ZnuA